MSYILDALRRADAERQRGGVPGLHDQPGALVAAALAAGHQAPNAAAGRLARWGVAGGLVLLAMAGAWWMGRGMAVTAPAAAAGGLPGPAAMAPAVPPPVVAMAPAAMVAGASPASRVAPPVAGSRPHRVTPPASAVVPRDAGSSPVQTWASLPETARAAMPVLAWSGAVHAAHADQRLVVVNGQVAREGDTLAPGLQLLQIRPKSVLLRWQGQRVEVPL